MLVYSFFTAWWAPATYAALSLVVPAQRRATASAMVLMAGALLGNGVGPIVAGWLSDVLNAVTHMCQAALRAGGHDVHAAAGVVGLHACAEFLSHCLRPRLHPPAAVPA